MQYKYAKENLDYSDFSSGRVFYSLPGHPAFPVRLASEIFQRCVAHRAAIYGNTAPCVLYDPCCGAAYHLSVLGYLHGKHIREIIGSDIDEKAVTLAGRNLGLLRRNGLEERIRDLSMMFEQYGKESHREALQSASTLKEKLFALTVKHPLETRVFQASATDKSAITNHIQRQSVDIAFTDVPYGWHSQWRESDDFSNPIRSMLDALLEVLSASSIVAVASDKQQKAAHERFQRLEQFQVGKRRVVILKPIQDSAVQS
jgi:23S rRNA (guanine2535-N1)-methyltransferase